jgi:hypothetical protein
MRRLRRCQQRYLPLLPVIVLYSTSLPVSSPRRSARNSCAPIGGNAVAGKASRKVCHFSRPNRANVRSCSAGCMVLVSTLRLMGLLPSTPHKREDLLGGIVQGEVAAHTASV